MAEVGAVAIKKKSSKKPLVDSDYKPQHRPTLHKRSPYPAQLSESRTIRESEEEGVSGDEGLDSISEVGEEADEGREMARREESDLGKLLKFMMEKEDRQREEDRERRREEEERRREYETFRGREAERRREEEETRRREEDARRNRRELLQEKLKSMGVYKEGTELADYLSKFERVMRESGVDGEGWSERLFPRLPERLCARVHSVREEGAGYEDVKNFFFKVSR